MSSKPAPEPTRTLLWNVLARAVLLTAAVVVGLWLAFVASGALVLFAAAFILAIVLNAAIVWLTARGLPRWGAIPAVLVGVLAVLVLISWLIVPRVVAEAVALGEQLPALAERLDEAITEMAEPVPGVHDDDVDPSQLIRDALPSIGQALGGLGAVSVSVLGALAIGIILLSVVLFALISPRPLLNAYLDVFPPRHRDRAERAFTSGARGVVAWMRSNVIVGTLEAVVVAIALGLLGVPGALVWAALAFFAELIPRIGIFLMAAPPVLVSLAVDPLLALAVAAFYLILSQVTGNLLTPALRAKQMDLHPVSLMFMVLALASVFGFVGALIATPLTAFVKGFYEQFYLGRRGADEAQADADERIDRMMKREPQPHASSSAAPSSTAQRPRST